MNITLCSAFRNSASYLFRYCAEVYHLFRALERRGDNLFLVWGEGDSTDNTQELLSMNFSIETPLIPGVVVNCSHGGPEFGSVEHPDRFNQLAYAANRIWMCIPDDTDVVLWAESDLIWNAETMVKLIDHTATYPAISPMVYLRRDEWPPDAFYDVWAARKDGKRFGHLPPYHACYKACTPFLVDSMGSCMAIRGEIARRILWDEQVFLGACEQIYQMGGAVWIDPQLSVIHQ